MTGEFIVAEIKQLDAIEGADNIVSSNIFGETIITSKETKVGTVGLLFDCETQLSLELCTALNLHRHSNLNRDKEVVGYFDDTRRVRPIKLKGVKCSAFFLPLEGIWDFAGQATDELKVGAQGNEIGSNPICTKYFKKRIVRDAKQGKARENLTPTFKEHVDTDQAMRNMQKVQVGDIAIITEKLHGTSARCGYLEVKRKQGWFKRFLAYLIFGITNAKRTTYEFVVGSRRVVKSISGEELKGKDNYYDHDLWTNVAKKTFEGKLEKGETVYFEIVGYDLAGGAIMGSQGNKKLKPFMEKAEYKSFIERYGDTTEFTYGCHVSFDEDDLNKAYVYRITTTNEDGVSMDLSWKQVKMRCEQMNVKHVPELGIAIVNEETLANEKLEFALESLADAPSKEFPQHLREGVCLRLEGASLIPKIFKHKGYNFKVLEGIIKETEETNLEDEN